tara:strand:+ start:278 stop:577 length:300 start_codon:yes stop_codon:yes gene_type:complete
MSNNFKNRYNKNLKIDNLSKTVLNFINTYNTYYNYTIKNIKLEDNLIIADLYYNDKISYFEYMDDEIRYFTKIFSEELRDYIGSNIYYDIIEGIIIMHV